MAMTSRGRARAIADDLRAAIERGDYGPGDPLPQQLELRERYGAATATVASAIDMLRREGLVITRHRAGVFVRERGPIVRLSRHRLTRAERQVGRGFFLTDAAEGGWTAGVQTTVSEGAADDRTAAELGIAVGSAVVVRDRVMSANGDPVQLATSYLPATVAAGTGVDEVEQRAGGILGRLEDAGHRLTHFREVVGESPATADEAAQLDVAAGTPLWRITRTAYAESGPVEVNFISARSDRVVLVYELPAE
jgi:GntR family transcriptional regulator